MKKEMLIGFLVALLATSFGCFLFIEFFSPLDFYESLARIKEGNLEGKVLVLGAIANFFVFFVFLKKKQIYRARGVLMETFLIAFIVLLLTLFSK
jgi:NADH:ubiquinone oxidoreductase subunit 5 (subunit L)/multisubunit Na+/H+ antiporter MnhA subunit